MPCIPRNACRGCVAEGCPEWTGTGFPWLASGGRLKEPVCGRASDLQRGSQFGRAGHRASALAGCRCLTCHQAARVQHADCVGPRDFCGSLVTSFGSSDLSTRVLLRLLHDRALRSDHEAALGLVQSNLYAQQFGASIVRLLSSAALPAAAAAASAAKSHRRVV